MERSHQRLLNAATALSIALCLASGLLSIRSYFARDLLPREITHNGWQVQSWGGRLIFVRTTIANLNGAVRMNVSVEGPSTPIPKVKLPAEVPLADQMGMTIRNAPTHWGFDGSISDSWPALSIGPNNQSQRGFSADVYSIPLWSIFAIMVLLNCPMIFLWHRSRKRFSAGLCQSCGYDLRATPNLCPECGTLPIQNQV
jgi:hypothetical protein